LGLGRFHQGADRVKEHAKLGVILSFESSQLSGQFLVGYEHPPHPDKRPHYGDVYLYSPMAAQYA